MTDEDRLREGQEVLTDPTYLRVCRGVMAFRLLACCLTIALTPPTSPWADLALLAVLGLSIWGMLADGFVRLYVRHPVLAALDTTLAVTVMVLEWPVSGSLLVVGLTALLLGLTLTPWLGLPGLILVLGAISMAALDSAQTLPGEHARVLLVGLPLAVLGMTIMGWTIRFAFVELKRSRDEVMAENVIRRHQEERQRLAREMHDSLGKTVNGIGLAAAAMRSAAARGRVGDVQQLSASIEDAARTAADESRSLLRGLRRHHDDRPIAEQLGEMAREKVGEHLAVQVDVDGLADLPRPLTVEVCAIAEEALENVVRHSAASTASLSLAALPDALELRIRDDGTGFDPALVRHRERVGHFGLRGMAERAETTGGTVTVESAPGAGTTVIGRWDHRTWRETR